MARAGEWGEGEARPPEGRSEFPSVSGGGLVYEGVEVVNEGRDNSEGMGVLIPGRNAEPLRDGGGAVEEALEGLRACLYPKELEVDVWEVSGRGTGKVKVRLGCSISGVGVVARDALEGLRDLILDGDGFCAGRGVTGSRAGEDERAEDDAANKEDDVLIGAGLAARPGCRRAGIGMASLGAAGLGERAFKTGPLVDAGVGARPRFLESVAGRGTVRRIH